MSVGSWRTSSQVKPKRSTLRSTCGPPPVSTRPDSSVYGYDVYRDGNYLGFTPNPRYQDGTVSSHSSYNYQVLAYDPSHNASALSAPLGVGTSGSSTPVSTTTSVSSGSVDTTTMSSADLLAALGFH